MGGQSAAQSRPRHAKGGGGREKAHYSDDVLSAGMPEKERDISASPSRAPPPRLHEFDPFLRVICTARGDFSFPADSLSLFSRRAPSEVRHRQFRRPHDLPGDRDTADGASSTRQRAGLVFPGGVCARRRRASVTVVTTSDEASRRRARRRRPPRGSESGRPPVNFPDFGSPGVPSGRLPAGSYFTCSAGMSMRRGCSEGRPNNGIPPR